MSTCSQRIDNFGTLVCSKSDNVLQSDVLIVFQASGIFDNRGRKHFRFIQEHEHGLEA